MYRSYLRMTPQNVITLNQPIDEKRECEVGLIASKHAKAFYMRIEAGNLSH
jgi:hypothetical protein